MNAFNKKDNFKRLKYLIKSISEKQKLKLIGVFLLIIISLWFFLIHSKIKQQIQYNTNLLQQINEKQAQMEQNENKCLKLENKIKNLKSDISCSNNKDIKKEIINYAKEAGISLKTYALLSENTKTQHNSKCNMLSHEIVSYEFSGKIDQIMGFCQKLNMCKSCLECQEIHISKNNVQEKSAPGYNESECNIKCTLKLLKKCCE